MKFVIPTQQFNHLIGRCLNVVSAKATIPILSNLLLEVANGRLTITATDLTVGIRCSADVRVIEEGATTLPAKKLAALIRELTSDNIEVWTSPNEVTEILADSSRFRLHGMSKSEFPSLPDLEESTNFAVKQSDLKEVIYRTAFAVSREDTRYVLTGVFLTIANARATFAGTDGKRLSRAFLPVAVDSTFTGNYIIPIKAIEEALKNLREDGDATIYLMDDKIAIQTPDSTIITKLLSGDFPDINRIIPESAEKLVPLHREELMTLLRQVSLFTSETNNVVRFALENGEMHLSAVTMEVGEGKVSMPANYHGTRFEIAFNPTFFLDILRHSKNETVTLGVSDPFNPGVITDQETTNYIASEATPLFVLMPMRLNEV